VCIGQNWVAVKFRNRVYDEDSSFERLLLIVIVEDQSLRRSGVYFTFELNAEKLWSIRVGLVC